jgi:hypothetical protein
MTLRHDIKIQRLERRRPQTSGIGQGFAQIRIRNVLAVFEPDRDQTLFETHDCACTFRSTLCANVHTNVTVSLTFTIFGCITRCPMSDVYVYNFYPFTVGGEKQSRSLFSATLTTIEAIGTPIMESQGVVDASQLTTEGYLVPPPGFEPHEITQLSAEIKSLEIRAEARDLLAHSLDAGADEAAIYMLSLESRHLRRQAQKLTIQRSEILAAVSGHISESMAFAQLSV